MVIACTDAQPRGLLYCGQNLPAQNGVPLDLFKFLVREAAFLIDDGTRHADLAHVVQKRRKIHSFALLFGFSDRLGNLQRILRYATGMAVRVGILRVDGAGQRLRRLFEHIVLLLTFLLVEFDFLVFRPFHGFIQVDQHKQIQQYGHSHKRHIRQGQSVGK